MILRLQHQRPDGEVDSYYLKPGRRYHIGRGSACEVRILDLKLSRKHCALEFGDRGWQAVDLMSTNGCTLNGEQIVGNVPVKAGSVIEAGQTKLTVAAIIDPATADEPASHSGSGNKTESETDHDHVETTAPDSDALGSDTSVEQEPLPEGPDNAAARAHANRGNEWEPEPNSDALNKTDALIPNPGSGAHPIPKRPTAKPVANEPRRPTAVFRAEELRADDAEQDNLATRLHAPEAKPAPVAARPVPVAAASAAPTTSPGTDSQERTFYITVLGRRVGPLTRSVARDLKARELKGTLTTADLEQYPLG